MPPAETTTCRPARSAAAPGRRGRARRGRPSKISAGLGQPALAGVGAGQPALGGLDDQRRRARAAWRRWPGWPGAPTSRCASPGRSTTGQRAVSSVLVSRSSARPCAALASRSAVAGATTTRSADWPIRTCGTSWTSSQTSVATGLPDSAAQVGAPTNSSAAAVGHDGDVVAGLGEPAQQLAGLVRRDAAADAEDDPRAAGAPRVMASGQLLGGGRRRQRPRRPPRRRARPGRCPRRSAGRR